MTPLSLCKQIVNHFKPSKIILEPCSGTGNFLKALPPNTLWCEITKGKDFFNFSQNVDWIITNPPYSKFYLFLEHSLHLASNIVFLITINHLWTKKRLNLIFSHNFGIKEILLIPNIPPNFPKFGFAQGCIYLVKNYKGNITLNTLIS